MVSEKEEKLTKLLKALTPDELKAYRYFIDENQFQLSQDVSDRMFDLYCNGSTCDEIRKLVKGYALGQIVGARILDNWDERKEERLKKLLENIPSQSPIALLESQEFLSDMIRATHRRFRDKLKRYIVTGNEETLEGIKLPNNIKDYAALVEIFMRASGQDEKNIKHTHTLEPPKEPEKIDVNLESDPEADLDELLGFKKNVKDAEFTPVENKQIEAIK